jgi:transposase-like protein
MNENEMVRKGRRWFSVKEREEIVQEYQRSGLTQRAFASRRGISLSTLVNWLCRDRAKSENPANGDVDFQAVDMSGVLGAQKWVAEVVMPNGVILRLAAMDAVAERLVKALGRAC